MVEIAVVVGWAMLWLHPKWAVLNKVGVVLIFLMAPSALAVWFLAPDAFRTTLYWWTGYLAAFLFIGSCIVVWRTRREPDLAKESKSPTQSWSPTIGQAFVRVARLVAPIGAATCAVMVIIALVQGGSVASAAVIGLAILAVPILPVAYLWLVMKVADWLTTSKPRAN
jgi:peptidoglycan/LPS O-acetylase OafA/YrhL